MLLNINFCELREYEGFEDFKGFTGFGLNVFLRLIDSGISKFTTVLTF